MLTRLVIHDVVLIEKLTLSLASGLNVFTGETGAGKSIVLDALGLALGGRSDAGLIRTNAAQASVTAAFDLPDTHALFALASEQGLALENPVILRRVVAKDGKSRAFLNDQPISIGLLRQCGESLLQIHGQFDTHGLLDAATHRGLLDAYAKTEILKKETAQTYAAWQKAEAMYTTAQADSERARTEADFLRDAVNDLDKLAPESGEADALAEKRVTLQHREKIHDALKQADQALNGERGAASALNTAGKAVARIVDKAAGLAELLATVDRARDETAEAAQQLDRILGHLDAAPDALERIEERLFALRAIARKHNVHVDDLPALRDDLNARLALASNQDRSLHALQKAAQETRNAYIKKAEILAAQRRKAAQGLEKAVMKELPPLKLERARFVIEVTALPESEWNAEGMDRVSFLAATNAGTAAGSLQKIASGGELARFMLALKVVLLAAVPVPVLVFDEVDTGIGGATASAVGERLARLAQHVQILVVTHSPQVAARGTSHLRVSKQSKGATTTTSVATLDASERLEEIARMLAGTQITDAARHAAASLLEDAMPIPTKKASNQARA